MKRMEDAGNKRQSLEMKMNSRMEDECTSKAASDGKIENIFSKLEGEVSGICLQSTLPRQPTIGAAPRD